jgi:retron-type reverse transcriptase
MFEDAPVNTGAVQWPDPDSAFWAVRRMQIKLHRWASEDHTRRFGDLFNLVYDPAFLVHAWERVSGNVGARTPGVDRATVAQIVSRVGVEAFLGHIRDSLKSGEFEPVEVRRVLIPKASGKLRKLGIPTVADRVVQASLKAVLEPIFEADFQPCSYGFRPRRRAQDAIAEIHFLASHCHEWVLEADIQACFDQIGHTPLLDRMRNRVKDKRVLGLVKAFLTSGVMSTSGDREETLTGTPQGGILSPLLAYIALSELDDHFDRQRRQEMGTDQQKGQTQTTGPRQLEARPLRGRLCGGGVWPGQTRRGRAGGVGSRARPHGAAAVRGEDPRRPHRPGLRLPRLPHPSATETRNPEAVRLHHPVQEGRAGRQGQGALQDAQVNPAPESGRADHQLEPDPAGMGNLLSARRVLAGVPSSRQPRLVADRRVDPREVQRQEPDRLEGAAPSFLRSGMAARPRGGDLHRRIQRRGDPLPLPR